MHDWWQRQSPRTRFVIGLAFIVIGAAFLPFSLRERWLFRLSLGTMALGMILTLIEILLPEKYLEPIAEELAALELEERWLAVPLEKIEACFNLLAATFAGGFEKQKVNLFAAAARIQPRQWKEFPLSARLDGAVMPVRVRVTGAQDGTIYLGFFAAPQTVCKITQVLQPVSTCIATPETDD